MFKNVLTIILLANCFVHCSSCPNNALLDSLFSDRFAEKFREDEVISILTTLTEKGCKKNDSAIAEFVINNSLYGHWGMRVLSKHHSTFLLKLLKKHSNELKKLQWSYFASSLSASPCWNDTEIDSIVEKQVYQNPDVVTRDMLLQYLSKCANITICINLAKMFSIEPENIVRKRHLILYCRFNTPVLNKIIVNELKANPYNFEKVLRMGFKTYNRYDFLPELYDIKNRFKNETSPLRKSEVEEILTTLGDVIPYLEKKKYEKATIGLPLDWGTTNSLGKE
ncbi:MAG: hypothetical protein JW915_11500 [Chitinispirillaceae bacterium]|nr:hypothetical protein [Chitinispirillaceae bacterium]